MVCHGQSSRTTKSRGRALHSFDVEAQRWEMVSTGSPLNLGKAAKTVAWILCQTEISTSSRWSSCLAPGHKHHVLQVRHIRYNAWAIWLELYNLSQLTLIEGSQLHSAMYQLQAVLMPICNYQSFWPGNETPAICLRCPGPTSAVGSPSPPASSSCDAAREQAALQETERKPRRGKHRHLKIFISPMAALSWCTEFKNWIYPKVRNSKTLGSCWLRTIVAHEVNLTSDQVPSISSRRPIAALNRPPSWRSILIVFSCLIMSDLISSLHYCLRGVWPTQTIFSELKECWNGRPVQHVSWSSGTNERHLKTIRFRAEMCRASCFASFYSTFSFEKRFKPSVISFLCCLVGII